jgi:hypothetical protein
MRLPAIEKLAWFNLTVAAGGEINADALGFYGGGQAADGKGL